MEQRAFGVFVCLYMGYMVITYIRKSVSFASPSMIVAEGMSKSQLGWILSCQMVGYTLGKLVGGVVVDVYSPTLTFTLTLLSAAVSLFCFTASSTVNMFAVCWFINGLSQGPSWPACARLLKKWCPPHRFGTWWSVLSTSMNVSGTAGPIVSAVLLAVYTWRFALNVAGTCAIAGAGMALVVLADGPEGRTQQQASGENCRAKESPMSWKTGVRDLLGQPAYLATCLNYLMVSLIRGACNDWGHLYLIHDRHHSHLTGSSFISSQELGGIFGSLAAGYLSDFLFAKKVSCYNPRQMVIVCCTVMQSAFIFLFLFTVTDTSSSLLICAVGFGLGFGVYGGIAMFGVVAMESATEKFAGTAHSIAALGACVGLVLSGFPLSMVAGAYSWHLTFCLLQLLAVGTVAVSSFCLLRSAPHPAPSVTPSH
ncbi:glucose-6-phosphate exchanger SLC37A4-like [Babylonia areolata]|uniref:glucose-6-phosphate exchanger SLC37A4-like n=1 Tax=Babylonia areolata TaxID=304850 RepID=UPI003FD27521